MKSKTKKILITLPTTVLFTGTTLSLLSLSTNCSFDDKKVATSFTITNLQDIKGQVDLEISTKQLICKDNLGNTLKDVTYSSYNLPSELKIEETTGIISGTPLVEFDGIYTITASSVSLGDISANKIILINPAAIQGFGFVTYLDGEIEKNIEFTQEDMLGLDRFCDYAESSSHVYNFKNASVNRNQLTGIIFGSEFLIHTQLPIFFLANMFYDSTQSSLNIDLRGLNNVDSVEDYFAWNMFKNCACLTTLSPNFSFPKKITFAGAQFANNMFSNCAILKKLPDNFNFPQELDSVGTNFAYGMFQGCSNLTSLPNGFNFPQKLKSVWYFFASSMFEGCSNLESLPIGFNLPQNIESVGDDFASSMFSHCESLTSLPDSFTFPQNIESVGDDFASSMFANCVNLEILPTNFNFPQNLILIGARFAWTMFYYCSKLASLPNGFDFPQGLTSVWDNFAFYMFFGCELLEFGGGDADETLLNFPSNPTDASNFAYNCFSGCTLLINNEIPVTPAPGSSHSIARN